MDVKLSDAFHRTANNHFFAVSSFVAAYYFVTPPEYDKNWEKFDFTQIILMLSGNAVCTIEETRYSLSPGMVIFRPAFRASQFAWSSNDVRFAVLDFVCDSPAMQMFEGGPFLLHEEEHATLFDLMKTAARICEPAEEKDKEGMKVRADVPPVVLAFVCSSLERFLCMLYCRIADIHLLTDETAKTNSHLREIRLAEEVKHFLSAHIGERLTLADISSHFWISTTALSQKFRRSEGRGVMEYFTYLKIEEAKTRIRKSPENFTAIAESLGFSSVSYFSKLFKNYVGMTPTAYSKYASKRRAAAAE